MSEPGPEPEPEPEVEAVAEVETEAGAGADGAQEPGPEVVPDASDPVARNAQGGVLVTEKEIAQAFKFFDANHKGVVDYEQIKERLAIFPPDCGLPTDIKGLMDGADFNPKNLMKLLKNNKVADFDPVAEAFSVFDPTGEGHVDIKIVRDLFRSLGMGELTTDEVNLIRKTGGNPSGYINLEDFRGVLDYEPPPPPR